MKLSIPVLWQRDNTWGSVILGYNPVGALDAFKHPYNIYWYGCLITCFSMIIGKKPDETNKLLQDNGGFKDKSGEFIWSKCTAMGMNQQYLSPRWDGPATDQGIQTAKSYLDQGFPLVCEIDFNPATNGEEMHFVLVTGYDGDQFTCNDPWTGDDTTLDKYGGFKRAVIQYRVYDKKFAAISDTQAQIPPEVQKIIDDLRADRDKNWNMYQQQVLKSQDLTHDLEAVGQEKDELWKEINSFATQLGIPATSEKIAGEISRLISIEDQERQDAQKIQEANEKNMALAQTLVSTQTELATYKQKVDETDKELTTTKLTLETAQKELEKAQAAQTLQIVGRFLWYVIAKEVKKDGGS